MPISELSDIVRMPRLGKIHLGIKVDRPGKSPYPKATDYFVCPPEVQAVFGEKPKELQIMFPVETLELFAQQWYRAYTMTQGLVCVGDGQTCRRKVDLDTGDYASHATAEGRWEWKEELPCDPQECPEYANKACRRVMNLQFLMPQVPGLGIWQIDTSSFYSIVNINSMIKMLKGILGRCSMIPLTLALGPVEVTPAGLKKKTVFIMYIKKDDLKLSDMARLALLPPARALIPEPEVTEPPEDLFPGELLEEADAERGKTKPGPKQQPSPRSPAQGTLPPDQAAEAFFTPPDDDIFGEDGPPPECAPVEAEQPAAPVFTSWSQLAQAAAKLGIMPSAVFKRANVKHWEVFPNYLDAWRVVEELIADKAQKPKMI